MGQSLRPILVLVQTGKSFSYRFIPSPTKFATIERFFQRFHSISDPSVWAERAVVFNPDVEGAFPGMH